MTTIRRYASRRPAHLVLAFLAAAILVAGRGSGHLGILLAQVNPVPAENLLAGTPQTEWDVFGNGDPAIQGFAADMSVNAGTTVDFKVDVNVATPLFHLDIYRIGYYQGNGARLVTTIANMPRTPQPSCVPDGATGLVDCGNWAVSAQWAVPADAVSGVYIAKAVRDGTHNFAETEGASHIVFIVRDDSRPADVLLQTSDTTWQAYNRYGGASLYCGGPISNVGSAYLNSCAGRAAKVSYNRPFDTRGHSPQSFFFSNDYPMIRFLEANGYNVKYWSGVDTDRSGIALTSGAGKPRAFISVGHDEYWSGNQRTAVENARNAGVNLAFFSGNEVYWKTRWEPSIAGTPTNHRTLVSYKDTLAGVKLDPLPNVTTGTWRDTRFGPPNDGGRPENALIGPIWTVNSGTAAITVPASMAGMRLWRGTRVADLTTGSATLAPGTLGYEWGEDLDNGFRPNGLIHLSSTTVNNVEKILDFGATVGMGTATHHLTLYRHNSGALVFGASTVQWAWGLDREHDDNGMSPHSHSPDQAMQQATVNLLAEMGAQPGSLQNGVDPNRIDPNRVLTPGSASADLMAPTTVISSPTNGAQVESGGRVTISGTALENGGGTVAAVEVSVDAGATWKRAVGTTTWSYEWSPGAVGPATIRSRGIDDSGNLESAATGGVTVQVTVGECPCTSLWKPSVIPANPSSSDSGAYELGVKFQSDINGFITGIRFYKGSANTGTHVGNLWTSAGTLMATATFTNESATGWQQVNFGTPVAITANTTYVASYHTPNGGYAFDPAYFTTTRDAPPLHAPASATSGGNGVFSPGGVAFPNQTFNANNYWVDVVFAQSLADVTPPVITAIKATAIDSARATVSWTTNEQTSTRLDYSTDPAILTATLASLPAGTVTVTNSSFVAQHALSLAGLQANTTYYYLVTAIDHAGNTTTEAAPTFTVPGPTLRDTASTDFAAGTTSGTYVSQTADGEVILAPAKGAEFNGPTLPQGWIETPWSSEGYSQIVNGVLLVDGARVATCATDVNGACVPGETTTSTPSAIYTAPHSLEFSANFSGDSFQHAGFAVTFGSASEPWAIFSTLSGGLLFARTNTGNGAIDTPIGPGPLGEFHRYRIDWKPASVDYYVDGALVVSHALTVAGPMRPVAASDFNPFGGIVFVDWMRLSPMATPGTFVSRAFDATSVVSWNSIQWQTRTPAGTSVALSVRAGNVLALDGSVQGAWAPVAGPGPLTNLASRYIQYRAVMATADPALTPELEDIIVSTGHAPVAMPDFAAVAKNGIYTFPPSGVGSLIANDTDADVTDTLDVVAVTAPSHGTAVLNADGSVNYTPAANYFGPDAFTYTVSDGLLSGSATVTINVHDGNMPPVANNDFFTVSEDTPLVVPAPGLLANDTDAEQNPLTAVLVSFPLHGMLTLGTNGAFTYTPALNYAGPDAFSYRANDGTSSGTIATVNILVNQVNDPPFTEPDSFNAMLNMPLDVLAPGVLANDHDVEVEDTAPMHTQLVSTVSHGTLTLNSDGSFSYVPNLDFLGTDSFTYKAVDHFNAASTLPKTVTITVAIKAVTQTVLSGTVSTGTGVSASDPLNTAITTPTAATVAIAQGVISGSASPTGYTFLNQQVNITVTDPAGAEVTATTANPLVFSFEIDLSLIPAGQTAQTFEIFRNNVRVPNCYADPLQPPLTFIPAANLDPCVSARSNGTKVKLTVLTTHASHWNMGMGTPPNTDNLFATNDPSYVTNYQTPLHVATNKGVTMNDLGPGSLSVVATGTPYGGTVVLDPTGAFVFTPNAGFCGVATFTYALHADSSVVPAIPAVDTGTASIRVNCIPIAGTDPVTVLEDSGATMMDVGFNDSDPDGQSFKIIEVSQGEHGTVILGTGGTWLSYQPNPDYFGSDVFSYTIQDTSGDTATGAVIVDVTPVNDAPGFTAGAAQTAIEDGGAQSVSPWATNLTKGPANENDQALSFTVTNSNNALFSAQPAVNGNGVLTYTPAPGAIGSATVTVVVNDNGGTANGGSNASAPQVFAITVTPVNDAPAFTKGADQTGLEDAGARTVAGWATNLSAGPADEAGQLLNFIVTTDNAALFAAAPAIAANGTLSYTPAANANGSATVTVKLHDNGGLLNGGVDTSAAQTFVINVTAVNDAPSFTKGANDNVLVNSGVQTRTGWATALSAGPVNENTQTLLFNVTNSNNPLFSAQPELSPNGTLTYTPAVNAIGSATVTVTLQDNGGTANGGLNTSPAQTFTITVAQGTTSSSVASSNLASLFKVPVTFTATVAAMPAGNLSGNAVTFKDGTVTLGTGMLNAAGVATFTTSTLAVGTHSITAVFAGTSVYVGSTSPAIAQVIQPSATLKVTFQAHALMDGTNKPKVQVVPVEGALVRVYKRWETCTSDLFVSSQPGKWGVVFDGADGPGGIDGCPVLSVGSYRAEGVTDASGNVEIIVPPTTSKPNIDYLTIGRSLDFNATNTPTAGDAIYAGHLQPSIAADDAKKVPLHEIRLFDGKKVAGKTLEEFGSYLGMVQPEQMEWTEDQTLYPVILIADGDWDVTTSIATPSGFKPEESVLSAAVANTTSAVQFSIIDVGSEWTPTTLTHVVKHKGTTRIQKLSVPMINRKRTKAKPDFFTVDPGSSGNVLDVLVNDNVAPPKTLTITAITQGANGGSVSIAADGKSIVYTPPTSTYVGRDSFTYTVDDGVGVVSTGTANIRVNTKPSLVIGDISVPEGNLGATTALFTVTLSSPSENEISFDYATVDGAAVAGIDFAYSSGTATLAPGQTSKTIAVQIIGNTVYQTNRKFGMKLWLDAANKTNAVVFGGAANGTIVDDDTKPSISTTDVTVIEGNAGITTAVVTLTLTGETALPATATYLTGNATAEAGSDYVATAGTVTFAPGQTTATIALSVVGDTTAEPTETFQLSLTAADQASLATNKARVTVVDDDATSWISTTVADFAGGTVDAGAYISKTNNGEVILAPALGTEFLGQDLPAGWTSTPLAAGGTTTIGNKAVSIDGASLVGGAAGYASGRSLEFDATFSGAAGQYGGFSSTGTVTSPFAMFGIKVNGTLLARTVNGSTTLETALAANLLNASQKFRIDWNGNTVVYWVNDKKVATHNITITTPMRPAMIDSTVGTGTLGVSWVRMTPYAAAGNYTSAVFDAGGMVTWLSSTWAATVPAGTSAVFKYRVGNSPTPDATWTSYTTVAASGGALSGTSRYFQFLIQESTTDSKQTPMVKDVTLAFKR